MIDALDKRKSFLRSYLKTSKQKKVFFITTVSILVAVVIFFCCIYIQKTEIVPAAGGKYTEGILGSPRFLNPLYSQKSEADRDLTEILFAGLMRYDSKNKLVPHLAKEVTKEEGRIFTVILRDDIYWSDGEKITAEDVVFTVKKIQNNNIQSPLRISWEGVRAEAKSEQKVVFYLESQAPLFLEKLTLKPIPKHIWEEIPNEDFQFSDYNLSPVSSGPYQVNYIDKEERIRSITLVKNPNYFDSAHIEEIEFQCFISEEELLKNKENLDGLALPSIQNKINTSFKKYRYFLPRYFALFFNLQEEEEDIRKALTYGINKETIINALEAVQPITSPIIPEFYGFAPPSTQYDYNPKKAISIIKEKGYKMGEGGYFEKVIQEETSFEFTKRLAEEDQGEEVRQLQRCLINLTDNYNNLFPDGKITGYFGAETKEAVNRFQLLFKEEILEPHGFASPTGMVAASTRKKLNELCGGKIPEKKETLSVMITTIEHPLLSTVIDEITESWKAIGVKVEKRILDLPSIETEILEDKDFEIFLFGIAMESMPDPFRWWHSEQIDSPGLNFTNYQNSKADQLLQTAVTSLDKERRQKALEDFQNLILEDNPAIFLYSPYYIYLVDSKIKGIREGKIINSSQRLSNISDWYINTKRVWKKN